MEQCSRSIVKLWSIYKPLAICSRTSYWTWQAILCACGLIYSGDARVRTEDVILLLVPLKSAPHIFTNEQKRVAWSHVSSANTAILPPEDPEDRKEKFSSMEHYTMHEPFWERLKKRKHWQKSQEQRRWGTTMHSQNTSDLIMTPIICFILWSSYSSCTATNSHAVKLLAKDMRNAHILLNMDNRIAIFYMNQMGRTHSPIVSQQPSNSALAMVPGEEPISAEHLPE